MALGSRVHDLPARIRELHRRVDVVRGERRGGQRPDVLLAAKAAPDGRRHDANALQRQTKDFRQVRAVPMRLVVCPDCRDAAGLIDIGNDGLPFERHVRLKACRVVGFDRDFGFLPRALAVARLDRVLRQKVAPPVDGQCIRLERAIDPDRMRQHGVFDAHGSFAVQSRLSGRTDHDRHRIAQHAHGVADGGKQMLVERVVAQAILPRYVRGSENPYDARYRESG